MSSTHEILLAYRHIYKNALRAVQYSTPARYKVRDHIRNAFRRNPAADFDGQRIARTVEFLDGATRAKGMEHFLVKNLLQVWAKRKRNLPYTIRRPEDNKYFYVAWDEFDRTVKALEQSMGMVLR